MTLARLKETFLRLPIHTKLIAAGAVLLVVSTFLPWYADRDSYNIGDQFLGITGPTSLIGIFILLLGIFSLVLVSYHIIERRMPRLPISEVHAHIFVAAQSLFLLLIVNSIYFHPKFGVNITLKESRFGMITAVIGGIILLIGGILKNREERDGEDDIGHIEPLIKYEQQHTPSRLAPHETPQEHKPAAQRQESPRNFLFGESRPGGAQQPQSEPRREPREPLSGGSYKIRTDL